MNCESKPDVVKSKNSTAFKKTEQGLHWVI